MCEALSRCGRGLAVWPTEVVQGALALTWYDLGICRLFAGLLQRNVSADEAALTGVAWNYGAVMRRYVLPFLTSVEAVWAILYPGSANLTQDAQAAAAKFTPLEAVDAAPSMPKASFWHSGRPANLRGAGFNLKRVYRV